MNTGNLSEPELDLLEDNLTRINEQIIRDRLLSSNIFTILNNEKMTPAHLKLAKINSNSGTLSDIKQPNGGDFVTNTDRQDYIFNFYKNLYGADPVDRNLTDIENFLGPEILANEVVQGSKIPNHLKLELDTEISIAELDRSIESAKLTSAGGMDGINNRVLKTFRKFFRYPQLVQVCQLCGA
jgi:hypothetical protein